MSKRALCIHWYYSLSATDCAFVGRRGSLVACATCEREIAGSIAGWAKFAVDAVLLGKALYPHVLPLHPGVKVGTW